MTSQLTLLQRIQARDRLTQSEQKIVSFFRNSMDQLAFESVTSISKHADVSKATVVRFIASLGYDGFADFQQRLRDQVVDKLQAPVARLPLMKEKLLPNGENVLEQSFNHIIKSLNRTLMGADRETFLHIARLLANCDRRVFVSGHRNSGGLAKILWNKLLYIRHHVFFLDETVLTTPDILAEVNDTDILFAITQSRYCNVTQQLTNYFSDSGATVIMLTDSEWMPYAEKVNFKLIADSEGLFVLNNACSMLAIIEALILAVAQMCEDTMFERSAKNEKLFEYFGTFTKKKNAP